MMTSPTTTTTTTITTTTTTGLFTRLLQSIVGVMLGPILVVAAIALLFWNEGVYDLGNLAATATPVDPAAISASHDGQLVAATGPVTADSPLGDGLFLRPVPAIAVARTVQMYAWVERSSSQTKTNVGGSQTTTTTYSYATDWVGRPAQSSEFQQPGGHENPPLPFADAELHAPDVRLGSYALADSSQFDFPPPSTPLALSAANLDLSQGGVAEGGYVYVGTGSLGQPAVGDVRVSYSVLPAGTNETMFGQQKGTELLPYVDRQGHRIYGMRPGTKDEAVATLHSESTTARWVMRGIGFILMWIGLTLLFGPISVLLDILPPVGELAGSLIGVVTFAVALALTLITVLVSSVIHSTLALTVLLVVILVVAAVGVLRWLSRRPGGAAGRLATS
jgi:hypothetical protein